MTSLAAGRPRRVRRGLLLSLAGALVLAAAVSVPRLSDWYRAQRFRGMSVGALSRLVAQRPDDVEARYQLGLAHARAGDSLAATRELLVVLGREPGRADALNDLGVLYLLQQRYYESLVALQSALTARPGYARALANLGRLHLAVKMPYTAVREFERALRLGATDAPTLRDLGNAYQQTLNFQSARRIYERVIRDDARDAQAWLGLARTYAGLTDLDRARTAARRAQRLSPEDASVMAALGRIELERARTPEELQEARRLLTEATARDLEDPEARFDLARALRRQGSTRDAIVALRETLRIAPDHAAAAYQLSQALLATGQTAEAERVGAAFRRMAARAREQEMLEERVYQKPTDFQARLRLARLYAATHRPGLALLQCRQILQIAPNHSDAARLERSLSGGAGR